jgi:uncharacterized protein
MANRSRCRFARRLGPILLGATTTILMMGPGLLLGAATLLGGSPAAIAQTTQAGYPQRQDPILNDYSQILLPAEQDELRTLLEYLRDTTGIEAVVVTIPSIAMYNTGDRSFEAFATNLFNAWGIGDAQRNDGVLVLFSEGDRTVRIELGRGYSRAYDARMQLVIDEYMLPRFRETNYSAGLYNGTLAMMRQLTGPPPSMLEKLPMQGLVTGAGGLILGGGAIAAVKLLLSFWRPKCELCQVPMTNLSETAAKAHLNAGQSLELELKSVFHNVLECPQCMKRSNRQFVNPISSFSACPSCGFKTLETLRQTTLVQPTYQSSGEAIAERCCRHCHYTDEKTVHLPQLEHSSSSDSSSGGGSSSSGGSSSGGGASGSW